MAPGHVIPTAAEQLTRDLYTNLAGQLYDIPREWRIHKRACWVMNHEWYDECRKIGDWPEPGCTTMLGLPYAVTKDGGFPHLIAD